MRAVDTVRRQLDKCIDFIHARRRRALFRAVEGVIRGSRLSLTGLGRNLPGGTSEKHRIKAVDRLLGNARLQEQLPRLYQAMAAWLLRGIRRPLIVVDGTGLNPWTFELRAALCFEGRALTLYSEIHPPHGEQHPLVQRRFLKRLSHILPPGCAPILVTDAGFHTRWFEEVRKLGWDFVGRLRNTRTLGVGDQWITSKALHERAHSRETDLGLVFIRRNHPRLWRVVLAKRRVSKHRIRKTFRGTPGRDKRYMRAAREPWLLVTSLQGIVTGAEVVRLYALRMRIEESFRDSKSHRLGWALSDARSKSTARLGLLLFIGALANLLVQLAGLASEQLGLQRPFQANTTRHRRVVSLFFLGCSVLRSRFPIPAAAIRDAIERTRLILARLSPFPMLQI